MAKKSDGSVIIDTRMNTTGFNKGVQSMGKAIAKLGVAIGVAFSVGKLIQFGKEAIDLGSDLQEVQNVVDVTFSTMNEAVNEFAKNAAETAGLSETMAKRYTGTFGAMAKAFGFAENEAFDMSTSLTQLAGDVASFYNLTQDEAYTKLKSVFTGETESLKDLGVVMTQSALDAFAMAKGYGKTTKQMTEQEKVALRYAFVLEQLNAASGDFVRTQDSWANQTRILNLNFDSFKANIGQALINIFTPFLRVINQIVAKMNELSEGFVRFSEILVGKQTSGGGGSPGKAQAEIAEGYENIADATDKAAKSQNKYLTGLDEIRTFQTPQTETVGTGGGIGLISPEDTEQVNESTEKIESLIDNFINRITELIKNKDWKGLGSYISDGIVGFLDFINKSIDEFDWNGFGRDVGDFISGIDWEKIIVEAITLKWNIWKALAEAWLGSFEAAPLETTILSGIALLNLTPLGNLLYGKILTAISNSTTINKIIGLGKAAGKWVIGGFVAAIGGFAFGQWIYEQLTGEEIDMTWAEQFEEIKESFSDGSWKDALKLWGNDIRSAFTLMGEEIVNWWDEKVVGWYESTVKPFFSKEKWVRAIDGVKEAFSIIWKGAINNVIELLNKFVDYINEKMNFKWDSFKVLGKEIIPAGNIQLFTIPKIPMLATGAVIPPNAPFMAMLGDQKHGTNIEAPLSTIESALDNVLNRRGGSSGSMTLHNVMQVNRRVLYDEFIEEAKLRMSTTGRNPFDLAKA